ncbi:tape measure protein [Corynebacterium phoceense]|uniref:tape measure protein n=1 Tax=Corynebacterium phoceense TaxID=1686286 RepID=UPI00211BA1BC|nr:tape measure protein [Corynebacterium phoceense]MCQ9341341.1 tape measure protein [Corynebacterium phoceense]
MADNALGWVSVPFVPTFEGITQRIEKGLVKPAEAASKKASGAVQKTADDMVKSLERQAAASKKKVDDLGKAAESAVGKEEVARRKVQAAIAKQKAAEEDYQKALAKGDSGVKELAKLEDAKAKVVDANVKLKKAEQDTASAQKKAAGQADDYARTMGKLEDAQKQAAKEAEKSEGVFGKLRSAMSRVSDEADDVESKFHGGLGIGAVAGVVSSITSSAIGSFSEFVSGAAEASDATDKFKSTLDFAGLDTSTIEQVTAQAQKYADQTVYDLGDIQNMTAQLAANGVDNYAGLAEAAGNLNAVAGGNADTFKSVGMVMSQTAGAGKLTTENWNQLSDAIPGASGKVQEALEQAGAYTGNFRDAMAEGQITAEEFNDAVMQLGTDPVAVEAAKSTQTFEGMLGDLQATIQGGLAQAFTELKPYIETFVNSMSGLAEKYLPVMVQALETGIEKLKTFGEWVQKNRDWLEPLVVSLGAAVAVFEAWTAATKIAAGVQAAFNLVMAANPIMLAVMAIAALVAGLTYFFTQTETGRELWEKFTTALGDGWDWVVEKLSAGWDWLSENVFQPLGAFFTETLWPTVESVLTWVSDKWQAMLDAVTAVWGWLRDNVLVPLASFFTDTLWPAVSSALGWVSDKWNWLYGILSSVVSWIWDNVIMRAIQGYVNLWNRAQEAIGWLVDRWNWMRDMLHAGWTWIDEHVFAPLGRGLDTVKGWFQTAVDAIGRIWDGIKDKTKAPVQFVVDVVYNNGIRKAWNAVAGLVGLDKLQEIKFATGGILPGYTPGRDPYTFIEPSTGMRIGLSGGEAIVRPEATRVLGSAWVDGVNAAARVGGERGVADFLYKGQDKSLGHFYSGGVIGSITDWVSKYYPMMTITSTLRNSNDYHGQGLAVDFSNGTDDTPQMQSAAMNLFNNYGKGLLELIHSPFNHNVKHGQDVGDGFGFYGAGTMNAHRNHVHVASQQPLGDPKNMVEMVWDGAKAVFRSIKERVTDLFNPIIDAVTGKLGGFNAPGVIGGLPQAFFDTVWGKAKAFILGKADEAASYSGAAGNAGSAESWREMAMAAMRRQGFNADDPAQVNAMLAQIMSESGGDPGIAQQIVDVNGTGESAGVGLLQIIPGTFAAHRDPELPDDRRDPWANMNAALRYYKSRYGTDTTTMWGQGHGYADGGILPKLGLFDNGGWLEHGSMAINKSGSPEPVFNAAQWKTLSDVIRSVGTLVPAIKAQTDVLADVADGAQEWLAKAADPKSIEGINARSGINAFLDLGLDLPGQDVIKAVVDGESAIWDARDRQLAHLDAIAEKEKALADARKELDELMADDGGLSKDEQRKLDDAKKSLEEAKAKQAEADSDEKRAAAADKVADAEEKLKRVREDQADNAAENAAKREEEITKANEAVKKSETELAQARQAQAKDLDNLVLLSQDSIMGMVPVAEGLAGQLTAMGAPAAMVSQGLGAVTSALGGAASMVGPAGLSLGVAVEMLKQAIGIIKKIVEFIKDIIERVRKAQLEALKTLADGLGTLAEYAKLVAEMQQRVASLQQELVRGLMEQRTAMFNLRVAVADKASAEMESAISVAKARQDLDKELEAQAKARAIRMTGLFEDWDSYLTFQADVAAGMLDKWSDTAISKLYAYESARATALKGELESRLNLIKAEDAARKAAMQNVRNQQDLLIAQERLIKMSAKVAGVDLEDATGMEQIAKVMAELAEAQQALDKNIFGRWGYKLGANGQFANEYRGQLAQVDSLRNVLDTLMAETGVQIDEASLKRTLRLMGETAFRGGDTMAVLRSQLPQLVAAEEKLRTNEALKPIWEVRDDATDMRRTVEDFTNEVELYGKTQPLEEAVAGLEKAILSLDQTSEAFADGNEGLRGDYLRAADRNAASAADLGVVWKLDSSVATPGVRGQVAKEVHIALDGEAMYTADQVDKLLAEVTAGTNVRVTMRRASTVATARRNGGI